MFNLVLWQVDPYTTNGQLVATSWDAGSQTGFTPASPTDAQLGFQAAAGTSTAQMEGGTVGAYINSQDLPGAPAGQKMMITPQYNFAAGSQSAPFADASSSLSSSLNLQIPVASGNDTYVNADFLFVGPNGMRLNFGVKLFANGVTNPTFAASYDQPSNSYNFETPLDGSQQFISMTPGSAASAGAPWLGWQTFAWSISQSQFAAALNYMSAQYPQAVQSTNPAEYLLVEIHLNAEFHFQPEPAELGWSMSGWQVSVAGPGVNQG